MADNGNATPWNQRAAHVRTFAKDVAAFGGEKKPQDMAPSIAPAPTPPPVVVPEPIAPKAAPEPVVRLGREPIPVESPSPVPAVPKPVAPVVPAPPPETKEDILARLREKAAQAKVPTPPATPAPIQTGVPIPLTKPLVSSKAAPLHTYKSDFSEHIDAKDASVFSVLAAEKDAQKPKALEVLPEQKKSRATFIIGGMLILLGLVGVYAAYQWSQDRSIIPMDDMVPSLVFADARREVTGKGTDLMRALGEVAGSSIPSGNVVVTYITTATTTAEGAPFKFPAPGGALIRALGIPAPSIFLRNILDESTVGVIHAGDQTRPFFIFSVSSYERTFAGMLDWEDTMERDLSILYPSYPKEATASTSPLLQPRTFSDSVAASRDIRVLKDEQGRSILVYGYNDKETLIVARDETAFVQLAERLTATKGK